MRRLTVKRARSFVACLAKMKVYIEDSEAGDTKICDAMCRRLGEIRNGESATFEIGDEAARIYVIADRLSADYCNDCYRIEAGCEDIVLSGRNKFNPAVGNAFRFDGNNTPEAEAGRKMGVGKGALVFISAILIGGLIGFGAVTAIFGIIGMQEKDFTVSGMSITLNGSFTKQSALGYDGVFISKDVEIMAFKDSPVSADADMTLEKYTKKAMSNALLYGGVVVEEDADSFIYTAEADDGSDYTYYVYCHQTDEAYWRIYFAVTNDKAEKYADDIEEWAASVRFE